MIEKVESKYSLQHPSFRCVTCDAEVDPGAHYFAVVQFETDAFCRSEYCPPCWNHIPDGADAPTAAAEESAVRENDMFAFWKSRRPLPESGPQRRRRFDVDVLWEFFDRLQEDVRKLEAQMSVPVDAGGDDAVDQQPVTDDAGISREELPGEESSGEESSGEETSNVVTPGEKVKLLFLIALLLVRGKRLLLKSSAYSDGTEYLRLHTKDDPETLYLVENPNLGAEDLERVKEGLGNLLQMEI